MMRHIYIRGMIGLIWLITAIICSVSGSFQMTVLYLILAGAFLYSAYAVWKKEKDNRWLLFLLLLIITICGISYSRIRKKSILSFGTEKEVLKSQQSLDILDSITVEIEGEVKYPGMYTIYEGYTLKDVVEKAGGLTELAVAVSLDWNVFDGQKIVIPKKQETVIIEYSPLFLEQKEEQKTEKEVENVEETQEIEDTTRLLVNINTAGAEELVLLPGIGEK